MSLLLSTTGCDRATAYPTSNKIIRHEGCLYIGWLDAPAAEGELFPIRLGIVKEETNQLEKVITLGKAYDNHCGPALALDPDGCLHAMLGAHHHPMLHRASRTPADPSSWSEPIALGPFATYPSLISDRDGTLHLLHRHMDERWQLWYRRKPPGKPWESWVTLAVGPLPGYNHFMQSLSMGPDGSLHILFQFAYTDTGSSADVRGRMAIYLVSEDGGATWFNEGERCEFPLTVHSARPLMGNSGGDLAISNHVVDEQNRVWLHCVTPDTPGGTLLRRTNDQWEEIDSGLAAFGFTTSRNVLLSRDSGGLIHLVLASHLNECGAAWHDPAHEIFHTTLPKRGTPFSQLSVPDPTCASWLPALEQWDWSRSETCCNGSPSLIYTKGHTGGRKSNRDLSQAEVHLHIGSLLP